MLKNLLITLELCAFGKHADYAQSNAHIIAASLVLVALDTIAFPSYSACHVRLCFLGVEGGGGKPFMVVIFIHRTALYSFQGVILQLIWQ